MVITCKINFDKPDKVFYSGQDVTGVIVADVQGVIKVLKIEAKLKGVAECRWQETQGNDRFVYEGKDKLLNFVKPIVPSQIELEPGIHSYNFKVYLPRSTPSTLKEKYGEIKYKFQIKFIRIGKPDVFEEDIKVICPLSANRDLWNPFTSNEVTEPIHCCIFFKSMEKTITCNLKTRKPGVAPGDRIEVFTNINNRSNVDVNFLIFYIVKNVAYKCSDPTIVKRFDQTYVHYETVPVDIKFGTKSLLHKFPISVDASPSANSDVLQVYYTLGVKLETSAMCDKGQFVEIPILIGNVASDETTITSQPSPSNVVPSASTNLRSSNGVQPSAPSMDDLPPSFEEVIKASAPSK